MRLTEPVILQTLMQWRTRIAAATWIVVRDTHAAEDIFQNVAVKAIIRDVQFDSEAALISWAFITARREGIDWLRRHARESLVLNDELMTLMEQEWQLTSQRAPAEKIEALHDCLAATPDASRMLLRLRYFEGCCCEEVAQQLGVGLNAVYKRLSRLHVSLRECVERKLEGAQPSGGLVT